MEENKSIEKSLDTFLKFVDDLENLNINISIEDQTIKIMSSLILHFESLVHTLNYDSGKDTLTVDDVTICAYAKKLDLIEKSLLNKT